MGNNEKGMNPAIPVPDRFGPDPKHRRFFLAVVLFFLVAGVYAPAATNGFVYDDNALILGRKAPGTIREYARLFTSPLWENLPYYRPVSALVMMGEKSLFGETPWPYHLVNAALMGLLAVMAAFLFRLPALGGRTGPAFLAAAFLGVHPIASACVYPITVLETLLVTLFAIAAVFAWMGQGPRWYALSLVFFTLALLSKEPAVVIPGLLLLTDILGLSLRGPKKQGITRWLVSLGPVFALLLAYFMARHHILAGIPIKGTNLLSEPAGPFLSVLYTLQTSLAPFVELIYEPQIHVWFSWRAWSARVVLCAMPSYGALRACPRFRIIAFF